MSDSAERTPLARRHEQLVPLLGAYADDELPPEGRREVDAHVAECPQCVQELRVQTALKHRLRAEKSCQEPSETLGSPQGSRQSPGERGVGAIAASAKCRADEGVRCFGTRWLPGAAG